MSPRGRFLLSDPWGGQGGGCSSQEVLEEECLPQGGARRHPRQCGEEDALPKEVWSVLAPVTDACPHRLARVQAALRRRAADLRDSLVLSEFLQDLQEEEARSSQDPAAVRSGARCPGITQHLGLAQGSVSGCQENTMGAPLWHSCLGIWSPSLSCLVFLLASARERALQLAGVFSPALGPGWAASKQ